MNGLIEKIKGQDKKVLIGVGIGVAVVVILIVALAIGFNKKPANTNDSIKNTQYETETEGDVTEVIGTEDVTENVTETEISTEDIASEDGQNQNTNSTVNPEGEEILGSGNAGEPYMEILGEDYQVTTVSINPGSSVYYDIYRVGGLYLTINDSDAYVIYNGTTYTAQNGVVSFTVGNALASEAVRFEIGNKGSAAKSFEVKFSNLKGSYQNPEKISSMGTYSISLSKGNEIGYYYLYTAEKTGKIRFEVTGTNPCDISVTNKRTSANRTYAADVLTDANGKQYVELEVNAGDEIMILVYAIKDDRGRYPAVDITWSGIYQ